MVVKHWKKNVLRISVNLAPVSILELNGFVFSKENPFLLCYCNDS